MPVSARERGSSRYEGRKHSGRGAWKGVEGIPLQATIVQPKTCMIMKTRAYLSLGALLLFLTPLGCSDKAESLLPDTPPEEPEFEDVGKTMEDMYTTKYPSNFYSFFRLQNAGKDTVVFHLWANVGASSGMYRIGPGQQATDVFTMTKLPWIDDNDVLIKDLKGLKFVDLYFNPPRDTKDSWHIITPSVDTCAEYSFLEPMTEELRGTPRDPEAWVFEEFPDKPNAVRWTFRITEREYEEAVRQTLERWADRDEEEQ